jgi:hypothetical protein
MRGAEELIRVRTDRVLSHPKMLSGLVRSDAGLNRLCELIQDVSFLDIPCGGSSTSRRFTNSLGDSQLFILHELDTALSPVPA